MDIFQPCFTVSDVFPALELSVHTIHIVCIHVYTQKIYRSRKYLITGFERTQKKHPPGGPFNEVNNY